MTNNNNKSSTNNNNNNNNPVRLWYTNGSHNLVPKTSPYYDQQQKKKICKIVEFAVPADHRIKLKEISTLTLLENWKKIRNMKVTIVPIVIGAFGTVSKWLLKGLEDLEIGGWVETTQTTALLKTARILRRVLETWWNLLSLNLQ